MGTDGCRDSYSTLKNSLTSKTFLFLIGTGSLFILGYIASLDIYNKWKLTGKEEWRESQDEQDTNSVFSQHKKLPKPESGRNVLPDTQRKPRTDTRGNRKLTSAGYHGNEMMKYVNAREADKDDFSDGDKWTNHQFAAPTKKSIWVHNKNAINYTNILKLVSSFT